MGWVMRFELTNGGTTIRCLRPLGDTHHMCHIYPATWTIRVYGQLYPSCTASNHTPRYDFLEWVTGFEPATF